jgi:hypothetical protein
VEGWVPYPATHQARLSRAWDDVDLALFIPLNFGPAHDSIEDWGFEPICLPA